MINLISRAAARMGSWLSGVQLKQLLSIVLVGFLLLTTDTVPRVDKKAAIDRAKADTHQIDSVRPKTKGEWFQEARETEDKPGERLGNIVDESKQAVKEFGEMYKDTADRSLRALNDDTLD